MPIRKLLRTKQLKADFRKLDSQIAVQLKKLDDDDYVADIFEHTRLGEGAGGYFQFKRELIRNAKRPSPLDPLTYYFDDPERDYYYFHSHGWTAYYFLEEDLEAAVEFLVRDSKLSHKELRAEFNASKIEFDEEDYE